MARYLHECIAYFIVQPGIGIGTRMCFISRNTISIHRGDAIWNSTDTSIHTVDGKKRMDGRIVVFSNVPSQHIIALTEANGIESVRQHWVCLYFLSKDVNVFIHGHEVSIQDIVMMIVACWDAGRILMGEISNSICNVLHASFVETRISHSMRSDGWQRS